MTELCCITGYSRQMQKRYNNLIINIIIIIVSLFKLYFNLLNHSFNIYLFILRAMRLSVLKAVNKMLLSINKSNTCLPSLRSS